MRIASLAGMEICELGRHSFTDDDRAGGAQPRYHGRIVAWPAAGQDRRAAFRRIVGRIDDVLDAHRHAVQRPDRPSAFAPFVTLARLRQSILRIEVSEGLHLRLERSEERRVGKEWRWRLWTAP